MKQFETYLRSDLESCDNLGLIKWWKDFQINCDQLSKLAIKSLSIPVASVDVERSFSLYRDILSQRRCSLSLPSINTLNMFNFNNNIDSEEFDF